jgi:hypothetical protein
MLAYSKKDYFFEWIIVQPSFVKSTYAFLSIFPCLTSI